MRPSTLLPPLLVLAAARLEGAEPAMTLSGATSTPIAIARLSGGEAISSLYRYEVELAGAPAAFESFLGRELTATLPLPDGTARHVSGICARVSQGTGQRLELVPKLWLLTRRAQSRMFRDLSVPEILARVLAEGEIPHRALLVGESPRRDCVVQHNETDFAFLSRLMEEEGIFYFFVHAAGGHEMVIANSPQGHPDLPAGTLVRWLGAGRGAGVHEWAKTQELRSGKTTLRDHAFQYPEEDFEVSALLPESVAAGRVTHRLQVEGNAALEVYDYPGRYAGRFDGLDDPHREDIASEAERAVAIRMEEEAAPALVVEGAGQLAHFTSGHRFTLTGHVDADGRYILTSVAHTATVLPGRRGVEVRTRFTCIPEAVRFRPPRVTPRPVAAGVERAIVTGPAGAEIHTDKYGRVKVQFHWDRQGARDENSSCWIRVGTLHAVQEDGWQAVPEVGDEVLVAFEHGDPDQPVIVGSVYNPERPPPH